MRAYYSTWSRVKTARDKPVKGWRGKIVIQCKVMQWPDEVAPSIILYHGMSHSCFYPLSPSWFSYWGCSRPYRWPNWTWLSCWSHTFSCPPDSHPNRSFHNPAMYICTIVYTYMNDALLDAWRPTYANAPGIDLFTLSIPLRACH